MTYIISASTREVVSEESFFRGGLSATASVTELKHRRGRICFAARQPAAPTLETRKGEWRSSSREERLVLVLVLGLVLVLVLVLVLILVIVLEVVQVLYEPAALCPETILTL